MQKSLVSLACCACFCAGCAHVEVTHVDDKDKSNGVHFYEPRPYLLVTASTNGPKEFMNEIIWLPDHSRRYKVEFKPGWGSMNGSVKLQNGWMLDTLGAQTDSKIPETITAVGGLITAIPKITSLVAQGKPLEEGFYLIDIDENGLVSFERTGRVK